VDSKRKNPKMTTVIISSTLDPASINIKNELLKQSEWEETTIFLENPVYKHEIIKDTIIITINDKKILHENIENQIINELKIKPKQAIFISRHRSKTGNPTLTTHPIGNYGIAEFGGKTKTLSPSMPKMMTHLLRLINKNAKHENLSHQICYEVTHHGPLMTIPTMFAEVGSNEVEWLKQKPSSVVAQSILQLLEKYQSENDFPKDIPVLVGMGGGHYAPRFTDVIFEKNTAFGHMIPSYHINSDNINEEILQKAIDETPDTYGIYIHRKALKKSQVTLFKSWCKNIDIPVVSSKELNNINEEIL
jgi:D-aminoacyl-tRNA deacylase